MTWRIEQGDVIERLREMPAESVHCVVTSPPYFGQRDYGVAGQIGLERTLDEYVAKMVAVFEEVRRVLRKDGTCWVNLGDGYAASSRGTGGNRVETSPKQRTNGGSYFADAIRADTGLKPKDLMLVPARVALALQEAGWWVRSEITWCKPAPMPESVTDRPTSATEKIYLLTKSARYFYDMEAERVAFAESSIGRIQQEGFWQQEGGPKDSGEGNRSMRKTLENFAKSAHMRETPRNDGDRWRLVGGGVAERGAGRNLWNYWEELEAAEWPRPTEAWKIAPEPFADAHFATYPSELPRRCISLGTSAKGVCGACGAPWRRVVERELIPTQVTNNLNASAPRGEYGDQAANRIADGHRRGVLETQTLGWEPTCTHEAEVVPATVLDCFSGSGTTGLAALRLGRDYIGIELNESYVAMSRKRIRDDAPLLNATSEASL